MMFPDDSSPELSVNSLRNRMGSITKLRGTLNRWSGLDSKVVCICQFSPTASYLIGKMEASSGEHRKNHTSTSTFVQFI